jgi:hypothetical protein
LPPHQEGNEVSTFTHPSPNIEARAAAHAAWLDTVASVATDDASSDLFLEIGELAGGLSQKGFAHDLKLWLDAIEEKMLQDAREDGGWRAWHLSQAIDDARADAAQEWLEAAEKLLPVTVRSAA